MKLYENTLTGEVLTAVEMDNMVQKQAEKQCKESGIIWNELCLADKLDFMIAQWGYHLTEMKWRIFLNKN